MPNLRQERNIQSQSHAQKKWRVQNQEFQHDPKGMWQMLPPKSSSFLSPPCPPLTWTRRTALQAVWRRSFKGLRLARKWQGSEIQGHAKKPPETSIPSQDFTDSCSVTLEWSCCLNQVARQALVLCLECLNCSFRSIHGALSWTLVRLMLVWKASKPSLSNVMVQHYS